MNNYIYATWFTYKENHNMTTNRNNASKIPDQSVVQRFEVHTNLVEDILLLRLRADCSLEAPLFIPHSWLILQPLEELLRFCNQRNIRNASNDLLHRSSSHGFFLSLSFLHRPAYSDTLGSSIILL